MKRKILIVDDQLNVARMVQSQIPCEKLGISHVGIATSASVARTMMEECHYDVLLCDIEMPGEDGISFAKWALEQFPNSKLIFLTSHADFAYVREALSIGSLDYLLQPTYGAELENAIHNAITQIQLEEKNRELIHKGELFHSHEDEFLDRGILSYLERETSDTSYLLTLVKQRDPLLVNTDRVFAILIHFLESSSELEQFDASLLKYALYNVIGELLSQEHLRCFLVCKNQMEYYCAVYSVDGTWPEDAGMGKMMNAIHLFLEKIFRVRVAIYCHRRIPLRCVREASHILNEYLQNNIQRKNRVILRAESEKSNNDSHTVEVQAATWKKLLDQEAFGDFQNSVIGYLNWVKQRDTLTKEFMVRCHRAFTEVLLTHLLDRNIESTMVFTEELPYLEYMNTYQNLERFCTMVRFVTAKLSAAAGDSPGKTEAALKYIRDHIGEDISVAQISDHVGLHPEYFTRQFKRDTGYSLKEYLIREKIKVSKMLLETTDLSVAAVAGQVGYDSYNNFIRIFKKYENQTPVEYRRSTQKPT